MKKIIFLISLLFLLSLSIISASQTNSSNYKIDSVISTGGNNLSSNNYKSEVVSGTVTGNTSSSSYKQSVGFVSNIIGEETPPSITPAAPSRGGGGTTTIISKFILNKDLIKILIKQGESIREIIEVKNIGSTDLNISLTPDESLRKFMIMSEERFILTPGESKQVFIDIFAKENEIPDAYTGRIIVKEKAGETKIINVIIEVKEKKPLFDMLIDVFLKQIRQGNNEIARIKVKNLGDLKNIDVSIYYSIKDFEGNVLSFREENIAIDNETEIIRNLKVPNDTFPGTYIFYSRVSYGNISASSTDTFKVIGGRQIGAFFYIILGVIAGLLLMKLIISFPKRKGKKKFISNQNL